MERNLETITTLADSAHTYTRDPDSARTYTRDQVPLFPISQVSLRAKASPWAFVVVISFLPKKLHLFLRPTRSCRVKAETCPSGPPAWEPRVFGTRWNTWSHGGTVSFTWSPGGWTGLQHEESIIGNFRRDKQSEKWPAKNSGRDGQLARRSFYWAVGSPDDFLCLLLCHTGAPAASTLPCPLWL